MLRIHLPQLLCHVACDLPLLQQHLNVAASTPVDPTPSPSPSPPLPGTSHAAPAGVPSASHSTPTVSSSAASSSSTTLPTRTPSPAPGAPPHPPLPSLAPPPWPAHIIVRLIADPPAALGGLPSGTAGTTEGATITEGQGEVVVVASLGGALMALCTALSREAVCGRALETKGGRGEWREELEHDNSIKVFQIRTTLPAYMNLERPLRRWVACCVPICSRDAQRTVLDLARSCLCLHMSADGLASGPFRSQVPA